MAENPIGSIEASISGLADPRIERNKLHKLLDIIVIALDGKQLRGSLDGYIGKGAIYPPSTPVEASLVVNPRGFRAYVRNDVFFQAIPLVLKERPDARFACTGMAGEWQVLAWNEKLGIGSAVE